MMLHCYAVGGVGGPRHRVVPGVVIAVVVVIIVAGRTRIVVLLRRLPLRVLFVLHPAVLEPYLDLPLRKVEVSRQLPPLLLGHVGVEEELLLQLQGLELGVRLALLPHRHLPRPFQRVGPRPARHAQGTCNTER